MKRLFLPLIIFSLIILTGCLGVASDINSQPEASNVVDNQEMDGQGSDDQDGGSNALLPATETDTCKVTEKCTLTQNEAYEIAKTSTCAEEGKIRENCTCNENSQTYWFEMEVDGYEGCSPACVVESETGKAEINWRCTGLIPPEENN